MSYWANRQKQLNQAAEKEESKLKKRLSKYYDSEFRKLEKQIAAYYQEYGKNNVIEYRKLMEALSDEDKRLLIEQMDEFAKKIPAVRPSYAGPREHIQAEPSGGTAIFRYYAAGGNSWAG